MYKLTVTSLTHEHAKEKALNKIIFIAHMHITPYIWAKKISPKLFFFKPDGTASQIDYPFGFRKLTMDGWVEPIADLPTIPHIPHQTTVTEYGQVMGSFRLIDFESSYQLRNRFWVLHQTAQNPQTRCIAHRL